MAATNTEHNPFETTLSPDLQAVALRDAALVPAQQRVHEAAPPAGVEE